MLFLFPDGERAKKRRSSTGRQVRTLHAVVEPSRLSLVTPDAATHTWLVKSFPPVSERLLGARRAVQMPTNPKQRTGHVTHSCFLQSNRVTMCPVTRRTVKISARTVYTALQGGNDFAKRRFTVAAV